MLIVGNCRKSQQETNVAYIIARNATHGTEHTIAIKPLTPNGEKYILPQLGFKYILEGDFDSPGDFVIIIDYVIPKSITEEQKKLLEEFYKLENLK